WRDAVAAPYPASTLFASVGDKSVGHYIGRDRGCQEQTKTIFMSRPSLALVRHSGYRPARAPRSRAETRPRAALPLIHSSIHNLIHNVAHRVLHMVFHVRSGECGALSSWALF